MKIEITETSPHELATRSDQAMKAMSAAVKAAESAHTPAQMSPSVDHIHGIMMDMYTDQMKKMDADIRRFLARR